MNSKKQKETYPKAYHNQNAHSQSLLEAVIKDMLHTDFSLETIQVRQWSKIFKIMKEERKKKNPVNLQLHTQQNIFQKWRKIMSFSSLKKLKDSLPGDPNYTKCSKNSNGRKMTDGNLDLYTKQ